MVSAMSKTIGILGGMGPLATLDLFEKIVKNTGAGTDQDHLPIIVYNNTKIPSRVQAYFGGAEKLIAELIKSALVLERADADFIIMPCHTSHIWIERVKPALNIPFYSMIENTALYAQEQDCLQGSNILLLATTATVAGRIYQKAFQSCRVRLVIPNQQEQIIVSSVIDGVKAGFIHDNPYLGKFKDLLHNYKRRYISVILGACTEIPILFPLLDERLVKIDPTLLLAKMAIAKAQS